MRTFGLEWKFYRERSSADQIEDRTLPCHNMIETQKALIANNKVLLKVASEINLRFDYSEIVEEERVAVFDVNPFSECHLKIWMSIPHKRRIAALVVAAVHIHISMHNEEVVRILNLC